MRLECVAKASTVNAHFFTTGYVLFIAHRQLKNPIEGYIHPIYKEFIARLTMPVVRSSPRLIELQLLVLKRYVRTLFVAQTLIHGQHDHVAVNQMRDEVLAALPNPVSDT